jgi:hypothetical protein
MGADGGSNGYGGGSSGGGVGGGGDGAVKTDRPTEASIGAHESSATPCAFMICVVESVAASVGDKSKS